MDSSQIVAQHVAGLRFEDLPASAVEAARNNLLDTLGVAIAGASAPGCRELVRLVLEEAPAPHAWVWGSGAKASAADAALANGSMAHALDFDDTHDAAILHAGVSVVPAALAVADRLGGVSGRELLTALAAGLDLSCRLGLAARLPPVKLGWVYTALFGLFGATVTAGKLMKLDAERMLHAIGIAYAQAAGNTQCMPDGALTKRMQPGFSARIGVLSALMARSGITGATHSFEGVHGLARVYLHDAFDRERLLRDLGRRFEHEDLGYKPFPCCRHTHNPIDVTLRLAQEHDIDPRQVESIVVGVNQDGHTIVCTPPEVKQRPRGVVDAQFSIPFCVATALVRREVFIDAFSPQALQDPETLRVAALVRTHVDPAIEQAFGRAVTPAAIEIRMKDGRRYAGRRDVPLGGVDRPMDFEALAAKFRRCVQYARGAARDTETGQLLELVRQLETVSDVRRLGDALA
jgi:2-methylcitrate dehydratase PrpD